MSASEILPINFSISSAAKRGIEQIRREYDAQFPNDPAAVLSVGWGIYILDTGSQFENVNIGFYPRSMLPDVAHGIQQASGVDLIFFTIPENLRKFEGRVLDHSVERGFFLRDP